MTYLDAQRKSDIEGLRQIAGRMARMERQRRKEQEILIAMTSASLHGKPMRIVCTDEATATRVFEAARREFRRGSRP